MWWLKSVCFFLSIRRQQNSCSIPTWRCEKSGRSKWLHWLAWTKTDSLASTASCDLFIFKAAIFRNFLQNIRTERHKSNCYLPGLQKLLLASGKHEPFGSVPQVRTTAESIRTKTKSILSYIPKNISAVKYIKVFYIWDQGFYILMPMNQ